MSNKHISPTGRFVTPPALQNIPIRDKELKNIRPLINMSNQIHTCTCEDCDGTGDNDAAIHSENCDVEDCAECKESDCCATCHGETTIECSADECDDTCNTCANA